MTSRESQFAHLSFTFAPAARNRAQSRPISLREAAAAAFDPRSYLGRLTNSTVSLMPRCHEHREGPPKLIAAHDAGPRRLSPRSTPHKAMTGAHEALFDRLHSQVPARLAALCRSASRPTWYDARRTSQSLLPNGVRLSYYRHANPIFKAKGDRHGVDHFQSIEPLRKRLTLPSRTGPRSCDACCERNCSIRARRHQL